VDLDYDSTGTLIASAGSGGVVHVWDAEGGFCTHRFRGHGGPVLLVRFAPVGVTLVSAGQDLTVRVWDLHKSDW
jgi:U3 small nucleolar RNA-associated protein 13